MQTATDNKNRKTEALKLHLILPRFVCEECDVIAWFIVMRREFLRIKNQHGHHHDCKTAEADYLRRHEQVTRLALLVPLQLQHAQVVQRFLNTQCHTSE